MEGSQKHVWTFWKIIFVVERAIKKKLPSQANISNHVQDVCVSFTALTDQLTDINVLGIQRCPDGVAQDQHVL